MDLVKSDRPAASSPAEPSGPAPGLEPAGRIGLGWPVVAGLLIIALFFGALGSWAALAPLESAAIAPGVVIVDTKRKTVQHLEGGIVGEILVQEGDTVSAGQVIIRLDETQPRAMLELLKGRYRAASALQARLMAERDGRERIDFPDWLLAESDDPKVAEVIDGQVNIFVARRKALAGQVAIIEQRIAQFAEEIKGLKGQIVAEDTQLRLISDEISVVRDLLAKGLARRPRLLALQRREAEIEGSRSQNEALIARVKQNIAEARLHISELQTTLINEVVKELRDVQSEQFDLTERMRAAEDVLHRTEIRAPIAGTIVALQVHTPGGVIASGEPLLDIVPSEDRLVIEARVDPKDIDVVHPGLPAQIRLTAFPLRTTPMLDGRVAYVSADRLVDKRTGQPYYVARVLFDESQEEVLDDLVLYPGMPAEVMIVTGSGTALDYILKPITTSLNRALREN